MNPEELKKMYNSVVIRHQKQPYHFGKRENETLSASNPICGDTFSLYLEEDNGKITFAGFNGYGCALSKASSSILVETIEGMEREAVQKLCGSFLNAIRTGDRIEASDEIAMLIELRNHGGRMDCVKLAWEALNEYLKHED